MIQTTAQSGGCVGRAYRQSPWPLVKVEYALVMAQSVMGEVPFADQCEPEEQEWLMSIEYQGLQSCQEGDVGLTIIVMVVDTYGDPIDLRQATTKVIRIGLPGGASKDFVASFVSDGSDGQISYTTVSASDLDQVGECAVQGIVTLGGATRSTLVTSLIVKENVPAPVVGP